jgi:hypothetical protein
MDDQLQIIDDFRVTPGKRLDAARYLAANFTPDMDAVCEIDLHCHSFFSDGYYSPANKVFEAYRRKMKAVAIADHDVFDGQLEALAAGDVFGIDVIPAIEFYTDRPGVEIIAHFTDVNAFCELLETGEAEGVIEPIRNAKKKQLQAMLTRIPDCFSGMGFPAEITPADIDKYLRNGISTKGDISVAMWQKYGAELRAAGIAADVKDFQAKYTTRDEMLNVPLETDMDLSPAAFIKRILSWGGLPGLPHPTELRKKEGLGNCELRKLISELASHGLQSIEVDGWRNGICPETAIYQTELFENMRLEYNRCIPLKTDQPHEIDPGKFRNFPLLFTNGSDDHNQPGEGLELGCGRSRNLNPQFGKYENIEALRKRTSELFGPKRA